jgi:hypothetical protein
MPLDIVRTLVAAVLTAAFATGPPIAAGSTPVPALPRVDEDGYWLLGVHLGALSLADSLEAYEIPTGSGVCLDFRQLVQAFDFPIDVDAEGIAAHGWYRSPDRSFLLAAGKAQGRPLGPGDIYESPGGLCVDSRVAAGWFGLTLTVDLRGALVKATSPDKLPVELAVERKRRRAQLRTASTPDLEKLPRRRSPYAMWRTPAIDLVASASAVDDQARGSNGLGARYELYASGEAARLSVDARLASDEQAEPESLRLRAYRKSADPELLGPLGAREFALGDVVGFGSALSTEYVSGRGAFVSNYPLDRPQTFDRTEFRGELPAGWDAELYRNGQLIGFADSRADGRYAFENIPLWFGNNDFEVVLYGPQGQVRRERRALNVGLDAVPPGETYYWAGVQQDNKEVLSLGNTPRLSRSHGLRAGAVVEHGIDTRTSVGLQVHTLAPDFGDERLTYVEGAVRRIVGAAQLQLDLSGELGGGLAVGGQLIGAFGNTNITLRSVFATNGYASERIEPGLKSWHSLTLDRYFSIGRTTVPVGLRLDYRDFAGVRPDVLEVASRVSAGLPGLSLTHEVAWQHYSGARGGIDSLDTGLLVNSRVGAVRLRGEARYRLRPDSAFDSVSLAGEYALDDRSDLRGDLVFENRLDRTRFGLGYARRFDRLALGARAEAGTDGSWAAGLNLAMSFGSDARGRFGRVSSTKLAAAGQAAARVFTDNNRDGVWQAGEPLHKGVQIAAGTAITDQPTGADGLAIVDSLRGFKPQLLSVDLTTLDDPLLKPARPGVVVVPRPGIVTDVEFPLLPTGEAEGTLYADRGRGSAPLPGADLLLVDADGNVAAEARSDFDGFFLFQDVVYGRYALKLTRAAAELLGVPELLQRDVVIGDPDAVLRLGSVAVGAGPAAAGASSKTTSAAISGALPSLEQAAQTLDFAEVSLMGSLSPFQKPLR